MTFGGQCDAGSGGRRREALTGAGQGCHVSGEAVSAGGKPMWT